MAKERKSGVLLHISSLPSKYGIGTLGDAAYEFADKLKAAGQKVWQILPVGPTGYGDSPYQSVCVFAGNPYFIDLGLLCEDYLIPEELLSVLDRAEPEVESVNYGKLYNVRYDVLRIAYENGYRRDEHDVMLFVYENRYWIEDYALFMAIKRYTGGKPWYEWKSDIRERTEEGMDKYRTLLYSDVNFYIYVQYLFFKQFKNLKNYVNADGIALMGDMPIYCAYDSADVWAHKDLFKLRGNRPTYVAGVPPDAFSSDGQLWGNPVYDFKKASEDGYRWWIERFRVANRLFDTVRVDHFRAFEAYYQIKAGEKTAKNGVWIKGPGIKFIETIKSEFPSLEIVAEDLGIITDKVRNLLKKSALPGMKVLEFAFYKDSNSEYLPHNIKDENCVVYTGTHDNDTLSGYIDSLSDEDREFLYAYVGDKEVDRAIIRAGMATRAYLFIAGMQDWLSLSSEARMNTPGTQNGNWCWRMKPDAFTDGLADEMKKITKSHGR